jgi:LAO/AO transport system kinase
MELVEEVLAGRRLQLAHLLTQIENGTSEGREALDALFPHAGKAHLIGVTGAPGTGKSTLVNHLARQYRDQQNGEPKRVGIVAVDPTSPFSGGAILGDRVRMRDLAGDSGVFIRSMASRGSLGGLATATSGVVQALDAAGFEVILIETVGAGQAEVEIARLAHTTLVVDMPGLGDDIQAIKAGIFEIADILVINKSDRPGVEATQRALQSMLQLTHPKVRLFQDSLMESRHHVADHIPAELPEMKMCEEANEAQWIPPILLTVATEGKGAAELKQAVERHRAYLVQSGELEQRERERLVSELDILIRETLAERWREQQPDEHYEQVVETLLKREISPWRAVESLLNGKSWKRSMS